jgi:hypothetical protein
VTIFRGPRNLRLPSQPSAEQLQRILAAGYAGAFSVDDDRQPAELRHGGVFLGAAEVFKTRPVAPLVIRRHFRALRWETTFKQLAGMAARLYSTGITGAYQSALLRLLARSPGLDPISAAMSLTLRPFVGRRPILHERVLYSMFQLAAEECQLVGRDPSDVELTYLALLVNDHVERGYDDASNEPLAFASSIALALRFNHRRDTLRTLARTQAILRDRAPDQSALARNPQLWLQIQQRAFGGRDLDAYLSLFVHPMSMFAEAHWGSPRTPTWAPSIDVTAWYRNAPELIHVVERWLDSMTTTQAELAASRSGSDIPSVPRTLLRAPFVRFGNEYWAASPWSVLRQLHTGVRIRLLMAARDLGSEARAAWEYGFGLLVEQWAQRVAGWARLGRYFRGAMSLPDAAGSEDVEDIVWTDSEFAILFSVKSTLMSEAQGFNVESDTGVIDWYERFLFFPGDPARNQRSGAAVLLNRKVEKIRRGETAIPRDAIIVPVLVMYEEPLDNVAMCTWVDRRCRELALFTQPDVRPLLLSNLDSYEAIMGVASHGRHLGQLLEKKQGTEWRHQRLDVFLHEVVSDKRQFRLPQVEERFEEACKHSLERLRAEAHIPTH